MSEADSSLPSAEDPGRAAFFAELMREEQLRDRPPVSGYAIGTLITGLLTFGAGTFFSVLLGMFWGLVTLVFATASLAQIRHRDRWGVPFVIAGVAVVVTWAVLIDFAFTGW